MTQVTCKWFKTPMSKLMCCFGIGLVPLTELQVTVWHFSMAWTAAVSCCRTAWICKDQIPWQTLALKHWLLEYMVDLPVGKRRCSFLCPLLGTRAEDPSFTCAQFPGDECCLPLVSSCSSILPSFDTPHEPPARSWRKSSKLMSPFVAKRRLLKEQQSSACWEWITNCE